MAFISNVIAFRNEGDDLVQSSKRAMNTLQG